MTMHDTTSLDTHTVSNRTIKEDDEETHPKEEPHRDPDVASYVKDCYARPYVQYARKNALNLRNGSAAEQRTARIFTYRKEPLRKEREVRDKNIERCSQQRTSLQFNHVLHKHDRTVEESGRVAAEGMDRKPWEDVAGERLLSHKRVL